MRRKKKKSIEELETELEQLITNSGRSEDNIHNDYIAYHALKRKIDNPDSHHNDDDIWWMNDLNDVILLGMAIRRKQNKINAARMVATVAAVVAAAAAAAAATAAAAIATSNIANTSIISSNATSADSSACHRPSRYVPYKSTFVPNDGTFGASDQGQTLDV
jgi:hypothetical protein